MGSLTYYVSKCLNISQDGKGSFTYYVIIDIRCIPLIKEYFRLRRTRASRANSGIQRIST